MLWKLVFFFLVLIFSFQNTIAQEQSKKDVESIASRKYKIPLTPPIDGPLDVCIGTPSTYKISIPNPISNYEWDLSPAGGGNIVPIGDTSEIRIDWLTVGVYTLTAIEKLGGYPTTPDAKLTITVYDATTMPSVTITPDQNPLCSDGSIYVRFTASPLYGGTNPDYTWYINGQKNPPVSEGGRNYNYITYQPKNGDTVRVVLGSKIPCSSPIEESSQTITMRVNSIDKPRISITSPSTPFCQGVQATINTDTINGGSAPVFSWYKNGTLMPGEVNPSLIYTPTDSDIIKVKFVSSLPCASPKTDSTTKTVSVISIPAPPQVISDIKITGGVQDPVCEGSVVTYSVPFTGYDGNWSISPAGAGIITPQTVTNELEIKWLLQGLYTLSVTQSKDGCTSAPQIINGIVQTNLPVSVSLTQQPTLCNIYNDTIRANPTNAGPTPTYNWYDVNNTLLASGIMPYFAAPLNNGDKVYVIVTSSLLCATGNPATSIPVTISRPTATDITDVKTTDVSCGLNNGTISITAGGGTPGYRYSILSPPVWTTNPVFTSLKADTLYFVQVTDTNGCPPKTSNPIILANILSPSVSVTGRDKYCIGDTIILSATSTSTLTYTWVYRSGTTTYSGNTLIINNVSLSVSGKYSVIGSQSPGCSDTAWQQVTINKPPEVNLGYPEPVCSGAMHKFTPGSGYAAYMWQDGSTDSVFMAKSKGTYWVKATDINGCSAADTVELIPCNNVYIPNAFSPNANGKNETFKPVYGDLDLLDFTMIIFDRWGKEIFETVNYQTGWDGTSKGKPSVKGVYSYFISYRVNDPLMPVVAEPQIFRGIVALVR